MSHVTVGHPVGRSNFFVVDDGVCCVLCTPRVYTTVISLFITLGEPTVPCDNRLYSTFDIAAHFVGSGPEIRVASPFKKLRCNQKWQQKWQLLLSLQPSSATQVAADGRVVPTNMLAVIIEIGVLGTDNSSLCPILKFMCIASCHSIGYIRSVNIASQVVNITQQIRDWQPVLFDIIVMRTILSPRDY